MQGGLGPSSLLAVLFVGAVAGWLAALIVRGAGLGVLTNMVVGTLGAFIAALVLPAVGLGMGGGLLSAILHATLGAIILLVLIRLVKRV